MENPKILLSSLIVTQNVLRDIKQLGGMIQHVNDGGKWTKDVLASWSGGAANNNLISIVQFPDGRRAIHDGHHRCVNTLLGKRSYLFPSEYELRYRTNKDYMCANLDVGWVTPFNPKKEVRLGDVSEFKNYVYELLGKDVDAAVKHILRNKASYACTRDIYMLPELTNLYLDFLDDKQRWLFEIHDDDVAS